MADGRVAAPQDPTAGIANLLTLLGGTQQTSNAGDTGPLRQTLAGLQGQDFNALLQSIFQQAGGQIPGLQAAYANAIGARSGGNSAVQQALNALLQQTTLAGQQQVAQQQAQNFQTQAQAGSSIASATKGTKQKTGTDLGQAAKMLAGLQALGAFLGKDEKTGQSPATKLLSAVGIGGGAQQPVTPVTAPTPQAPVAAPLGFMTQDPFGFPQQQTFTDSGSAPVFDFSSFAANQNYVDPFSFTPDTTNFGMGNYSFDLPATSFSLGGLGGTNTLDDFLRDFAF